MQRTIIVIAAVFTALVGLDAWSGTRTASAETESPTVAPAPSSPDTAEIPWSDPDVESVRSGKCGPGSCRTGTCAGSVCSTCGREIMTACCEDGNGRCFPCNPRRCPPCPEDCS